MHKNRFTIIAVIMALAVFGSMIFIIESKSSIVNTNTNPFNVNISVYDNVNPEWQEYVESRFPDVNIQWSSNHNDVKILTLMARNGDLPDIIAIKDFKCKDMLNLEPYLAEIKDEDLLISYTHGYIEDMECSKHKIKWLPEPGVIESILVNKTLLEKNKIPVPTDIGSFIYACQKLEEKGIIPFEVDENDSDVHLFLMNYLAYNNFIEYLDEKRKEELDKKSEIAQKHVFEDPLFYKVPDSLRLLSESNIIKYHDKKTSTEQINKKFLEQKVAMIYFNSEHPLKINNKFKTVALPVFGKNELENKVYQYPIFSIAMAGRVSEDDQKNKIVKNIVRTMVSEDAQRILNNKTAGLISYWKNIRLERKPEIRNLELLISNGAIAREHFKNIDEDVLVEINKMLFFEGISNVEYISLLKSFTKERVIENQIGISQQKASQNVEKDLYIPFASVVAESLKQILYADFALVDKSIIKGNLYKGSYNESQLESSVRRQKLYVGNIVGAEVIGIIDLSFENSVKFEKDRSKPYNDIPVFVGARVDMGLISGVQNFFMWDNSNFEMDKKYRMVLSEDVYNSIKRSNPSFAEDFIVMQIDSLEALKLCWSKYGDLPKPRKSFFIDRQVKL